MCICMYIYTLYVDYVFCFEELFQLLFVIFGKYLIDGWLKRLNPPSLEETKLHTIYGWLSPLFVLALRYQNHSFASN